MYSAASRRALSLVELVVVVAVLAIVIAVGIVVVGRGSTYRDAAALARAISATRWLAVTTGAPSALVARGDALYLSVGAPLRCDAPRGGGEPAWNPTGPVSLAWPAAGLAFGAHGRPLRCDGSAVGNATISLTGRDGSSAAVIVASLGRVRWERR